MNRNLPHAELVIRTALSVSTSNQARAVAHALDTARLLVDPERSFGLVLHRTPNGGWARRPEQPTELERLAFDWDHACERARLLAATIEQHIGGHPDFLGVRADGDRVRVELHVTDQEQWRRWRAHFGIRRDAEEPLRNAVVGESRHSGVRVSVLAHRSQQLPPPRSGVRTASAPPVAAEDAEDAERPSVPTAASAFAPAPVTAGAGGSETLMYEFDGITYDLALPQQDVHGDVWYFHGSRTPDGMPLLSMDGRPERCTLANVTYLMGPLAALAPRAARPVRGVGADRFGPDTPAAAAPPAVRRPQVVRLGAARLAAVATPGTGAPAPADPPAASPLAVVRLGPVGQAATTGRPAPTSQSETADPADPAEPPELPGPPVPAEPRSSVEVSAPVEVPAQSDPSPPVPRPTPALPSAAALLSTAASPPVTALASVPGGPYVPGIRRVGLVRTGPVTWEAAERAADRTAAGSEK